MKAFKILIQSITFASIAGLVSLSVSANGRCNTFYAADSSYHSSSEQIDIIQHAEPDLPPVINTPSKKKKQKSSTNFFSWLTKSHTMPSLHFIEFIELFDEENG